MVDLEPTLEDALSGKRQPGSAPPSVIEADGACSGPGMDNEQARILAPGPEAVTRAPGIAVFVKTPGVSPIKTRLAASIGCRAAVQVYQACVDCVREAVEEAVRLSPMVAYWAVAESGSHAAWKSWPVLCQGEGDLGERMARVSTRLLARHPVALLLGADVPGISAQAIVEAVRSLQRADPRGVLAPAADGGFVLVGTNRLLPIDTWTAPSYGGPQACRGFLDAAAGHLGLDLLAVQQDLDTLEDLKAIAGHPPRRPSRAQRRFWRGIPGWLESAAQAAAR